MFFRKRLVFPVLKCVLPQSSNYQIRVKSPNERMSLCALKRGSLTVEAALIMPFFLMILLAFFSFFLQYASAAELKVQAAAEAKKVGIAIGGISGTDSGDVTIYKSKILEDVWEVPFIKKKNITQSAVCRAWIGFTELETEEVYVFATPNGAVYHLYRDCTHLELSIQSVTFGKAKESKNMYGEKYRECDLCEEKFGVMVYITSEGNCYHSERSCSGLKRTVRQVPLSSMEGSRCCIRCIERGA